MRGWLFILAGPAIALLAACQPVTEGESLAATDPNASFFELVEPLDSRYVDAEAPYQDAMRHLQAGDYQVAQKFFQAAVEKAPHDTAAWIGLAATYDRLARHDLADRAYARATRIAGPTPQILNNEGYSRLLRGDLAGARGKLLAAFELDPDNPVIRNNLILLSSSAQTFQDQRPASD